MGYEWKFPDSAEREAAIREVIDRYFCCIYELTDTIVNQSEQMYYGTPQQDTFIVYHDCLSTF